MSWGLPGSDLLDLPPPAAMDEPSRRCLDLWRAALLQLLLDAGRPLTTRRATRWEVQGARDWLATSSRDRALVFAFAGVDLAAFVTRGLPRLQAEWATADAAPERVPRMARVVDEAEQARRSARMRQFHARRAAQDGTIPAA